MMDSGEYMESDAVSGDTSVAEDSDDIRITYIYLSVTGMTKMAVAWDSNR